MEAATECIPTKPRAKRRIPWESLVVMKKRDNILNKKIIANANAQKLKKALRELRHTKKNKNTFKVRSIK